MPFSSTVRKSDIPSVLVWVLDLLQGHTFHFKMHVMFMLCLVGGRESFTLLEASVSFESKHLET